MTTANTRVAQILLKRGNTAQSGSYVGPLGEVTLDTDLDTLRIHDGTTPGGFSILATKADVDQLNSDIGNISLGVVDTAPIIANVQIAVQSTINANVTAANAAIARLDANLGTATTNIASLLANAATQEGHITSLTASVATLSTGISAMTANAAAQEVHINQINANVTAANAAIASLASNSAIQQGLIDSLSTAVVTNRIVNGDFSVNIQSDGSVVLPLGNHNSRYQGAILSSNESSAIYMDVQTDSVDTINGGIRLETWNEVPIDIATNVGGSKKNWRFGSDGVLNLPLTAFGASDQIKYGTGNLVVWNDGGWALGVYDGTDLGTEGMRLSPGIEGNVEVILPANQDAGTNALQLNNYAGNVQVNANNHYWNFNSDGNLVLPTVLDFTASPAGHLGGNIVFGDSTLQNTAWTGVVANVSAIEPRTGSGTIWYNTEDGRTYVNSNGMWQDASPAVVPGNMVAYESNSNVELRNDTSLVFPDTTVQSTAFDTHVGNTAPASGLIWYNTEDGRTYNKVNGQWVDANPAVLPGDLVTFNDSGNITLPVGGQVTWANGRSILHGITAGSSADTGDITFAGVKIKGDGNASQSGAINLVPNDYLYDAGQWVSIYPTNQFDYPHVHIAAGTGGELYIGNDLQYVKTAIDGSISISSYNGSSTNQWTFGNEGTLTTNGTINIDGEGKGLIVDAAGLKRFGFMKYAGIEGALTHNSVVPIRIGRTAETDITQAGSNSFTKEVYIGVDGKVGVANVAPAHSLSLGGDIYTAGNIVFADGTLQSTANPITKFSSTWSVTEGTNSYSFEVTGGHTYIMWVMGNIPNGIIKWNARVSVSNTNVPVIGDQYAWVYSGGGTPLDFTSIPNQFTGTANTIVRSTGVGVSSSNVFTFGIDNTSGSTQTVNYGWVKIS